MLTLGFVTGTQPDKWLRRFRDTTAHGVIDARGLDDPFGPLVAGELDLALVRLPDERIDDRFHVIRLYNEAPGIAVPTESVYATVGEEIAATDLADEIVTYRIPSSGVVSVTELRAALHVVAANVGVAIAPRPLINVLSKKKITHLHYRDDSIPETSIALIFYREHNNEEIQDFVGVAKGRTSNSSRQSALKRSAHEKTKAKQGRREPRRELGNRASSRGAGTTSRRKRRR